MQNKCKKLILKEAENLVIGSLELRETTLYGEDGYQTLEVAQWCEENSCITLASWWFEEDDKCWEVNFCGDRPFQPDVDKDIFWTLLKMGQAILNDVKSPPQHY